MNSFLAGLLDRAEGRAPVLERRMRALFEPRNAGDSRLEPLEQIDTVVSEAAPRQPVHALNSAEQERRDERRSDDEGVEYSRNAPRSPSRERQTAEAAKSEPRRVVVPPDVPRARERTVPAEAVQPTRPATRIEAVVERHESLVTVTKLVDARHDSERAAPRRESRTDDSARGTGVRRGAGSSPAVNQTTVIVERARMIPAPTPRPNPRVAAESAVRLAHAQAVVGARQETRTVAAPPPVQITIGRVEVRAVSEKRERSQPKGPGAPRLSLDEYLRQRSGANQ